MWKKLTTPPKVDSPEFIIAQQAIDRFIRRINNNKLKREQNEKHTQ